MPKRFTRTVLRTVLALLLLALAVELIAHLVGEIFWFQEVGYLRTFWQRLLWQLGLFGLTSGFSLWFLLGNLRLASRWSWSLPLEQGSRSAGASRKRSRHYPESQPLRLSRLLALVLGFNLLISLMLLYYSQVAVVVWTPDFNLPNVTPPLPSAFNINSLPNLLPQIARNAGKLALIVLISIILILKPRFWLRAIACLFSLVFGLAVSGNWTRVLKYWYAVPFEGSDPQFGLNLSFYAFQLPFWRLLDFWLGGLFLYGLAAVSLSYLLSGNSLSEGKFPGFSHRQLRHIYTLGGLVMGIIALRHWLARYELLNSPSGVVYGASYTDIHIRLPFETICATLAAAIAFWLFYQAIFIPDKPALLRRQRLPRFPFSPLPFYTYLACVLVGLVVAAAVQSLIVEPNELAREKAYIERNIAFTRAAFDLDKIQPVRLDGTGKLTPADLLENRLTIDNIRLWDTRPLLKTNRQLQEIRLYYKFVDADYDRYSLPVKRESAGVATALQQVMVAARELDYQEVPEQAKTWVNEHWLYTHGYGFTLSPVNLVDRGGLPFYFVKDIGTDVAEEELRTSSETIRSSVPTQIPRIYYGELANTYIMTNGNLKELDFPSGQENAYNNYDGRGGIAIGSRWRRWLFAAYLRDWQMLFSRNFTTNTRLLIRRNINQRVRQIAPFLQYDRDPYLVVVDGGDTNRKGQPTSLYWIMDAYTTSDRYPYSDPGERNFNYIRNSVKIAIDAYNGTVNFYIADASDPIVQTWSRIFPEMFQPLAAMPDSLRHHIRYPEDLLSTQSERLLTYHMKDPQVFYNREDQWRIPKEIYGTEQQQVAPYYLIMKLPGGTAEEFILFHVYTPTSRNNLIGGLFARSDAENYGKLLMFELPKQKLIYGPEQIEALINQDPKISQQISLWNREGSRVIQGNLLVIPIEQSLLYVEPLYLEATENSLPTLARVIVAYENQIVMNQTLKGALDAIFQPETP